MQINMRSTPVAILPKCFKHSHRTTQYLILEYYEQLCASPLVSTTYMAAYTPFMSEQRNGV